MRLFYRYSPFLCAPAALLMVAACTTGSGEQPPADPTSSQSQHVTLLPPPPDKIEEVVDGRTVRLSDGLEARILGLAPPGECFAAAAATFARETLVNKPVRYSRASVSVISVRLPDNVDYATFAVSRGVMRAENDPVLAEAEKPATQAGLGLWGPPCNGKDSTATPTPAPAPPPPPADQNGCAVTYRVAKEWAGGFHTEVIVRNPTQTAVSPWEVRWVFPTGQKIWQTWNAAVRQDGPTVSAQNPPETPSTNAGGHVSFRFNASTSGPNVAPNAFTLNGRPCTLG